MHDYVIEREFEHARYKCIVVFQSMGHRCGYVGIPKEHPLYGKHSSDYLDIKKSDIEGREVSGIIDLLYACLDSDERITLGAYLQCHGGITYNAHEDDYPIKSDLWWFGFDCAHAGDRKDYQRVYDLFPERREETRKRMEFELEYWIDDEVARSEQYVVEECKHLAEQLKEFEKGGKTS